MDVYSIYFGYPTAASLAMGMPIAFPASFLIRTGMHASDAYSTMVAAWLILAFSGAYSYARLLGVKKVLSMLAALLWMSMPFTWGHADYSSLSVGVSMIPLYSFVATIIFVYPSSQNISQFKGGSFCMSFCVPFLCLWMGTVL